MGSQDVLPLHLIAIGIDEVHVACSDRRKHAKNENKKIPPSFGESGMERQASC